MSIFATLAVVCAFSFATDKNECNDYVLDHAQSKVEAQANTEAKQIEFTGFYNNNAMQDWLDIYNIPHSLETIESIEVETQEIAEDYIP